MILPEQSQLEVLRSKHEQTLYDQLVNRVLKHQAEFPLFIIQVNTTASRWEFGIPCDIALIWWKYWIGISL